MQPRVNSVIRFIGLVIAAAVGGAGVNVATGPASVPYVDVEVVETRLVARGGTEATTTVDAAMTETLDSAEPEQGLCFKIKDQDGSGYSYLAVNDGKLYVGTEPCE